MESAIDNLSLDYGTYPYRDLVLGVLSPGAVGALEQLTAEIQRIYGLQQLLDAQLPDGLRGEHAERLAGRVRRVVRLLPPEVSAMPNEVFTAVEFLLYEVLGEPVRIGEAILRLETLAEEIRARPLLHDLLMGKAN